MEAAGPTIRRSAASTSSAPAPIAGPFHTATVGAGNDASRAAGSRKPVGVGTRGSIAPRPSSARTTSARGGSSTRSSSAASNRPHGAPPTSASGPGARSIVATRVMCDPRLSRRRARERVDLGAFFGRQHPGGGGRGVGPDLLGRRRPRDDAPHGRRAGQPRERELRAACGRARSRTRGDARRRRASRRWRTGRPSGPTLRAASPRGAPRPCLYLPVSTPRASGK